MKIKQLVSHIAKFEGKKHEASVGDIKEIVGIISDLIYIESSLNLYLLYIAAVSAELKRKERSHE